jgi:hypothetical protein
VTPADTARRIEILKAFKDGLASWHLEGSPGLHSQINQQAVFVRREVVEAGCFRTVTLGPPPIVGGLVMRNVDPFDMMLDPPYGVEQRHPVGADKVTAACRPPSDGRHADESCGRSAKASLIPDGDLLAR